MRYLELGAYGEPLRLRDGDAPVPEGDEVLIRVQRCGVCHTDVHLRHGYYELGGGKRWQFAERGLKPPIRLGHEIYGEIVATGATGGGMGRRGVVFPWIGCGVCATCLAGDEHLCPTNRFLGLRTPGGYGDYVSLPHERYLMDTGSLDPSQAAALACAGITAYSALRKADRVAGWLGVIGAGGIGLTAIALARATGREQVVAFEPNAARREAALQAGATHAVDPGDGAAVAAVASTLGGPAAAMLDFVGRPETYALGTDGIRRGGVYVIVGLFGGETTMVLPIFALRAITVTGSAVGSFTEMQELVRLARSGALPELPMRERALGEADQALDELEAGRVIGRVVLKP